MVDIEPFGTPKGQTDAMQAYRILAADGLKPAQRRSTAHIVLRVHLTPAEAGTGCEDLRDMRAAQANPSDRRDV